MYAFDASPGVQKSGLMKIFEFSKLSDLGKIRGPDRQALSRSKNVLASRINSRMRVLERWEIRRSRGAPPFCLGFNELKRNHENLVKIPFLANYLMRERRHATFVTPC